MELFLHFLGCRNISANDENIVGVLVVEVWKVLFSLFSKGDSR